MLPIWSFPYRQEIAQNLSFHESVLTVMKQVTDQAGKAGGHNTILRARCTAEENCVLQITL